MYNNEIKEETGEQVGYWMINDEGVKQAIWHTHHQFYKESNDFLKNYYTEKQTLPSLSEFQKAALQFKSIN